MFESAATNNLFGLPIHLGVAAGAPLSPLSLLSPLAAGAALLLAAALKLLISHC